MISLPEISIYVLKHGFQNLWETIARKEGLRIIYNADVIKVRRKPSAQIAWRNRQTGEEQKREFDFIMWTPNMKDSLPKFTDLTILERGTKIKKF